MGAPTDVLSRIDEIERELRGLSDEVHEIRALVTRAAAGTRPLRHALADVRRRRPSSRSLRLHLSVRPLPAPECAHRVRRRPAPAAHSRRGRRPSMPAKPPRTSARPRSSPQDWDLLGPRGFAIIGGAVTAFGIILLFVLAANRGWITPDDAGRVRCLRLGGAPSASRSGCGRATASCRCRSAPPAQASQVATRRWPPRQPATTSCPTGSRSRSPVASPRSPS